MYVMNVWLLVVVVGLTQAREWVKQILGILQLHYPERGKVIILCNTPGWFSILWKLLKPLLNEVSRRMV